MTYLPKGFPEKSRPQMPRPHHVSNRLLILLFTPLEPPRRGKQDSRCAINLAILQFFHTN